MEKSEIAVGDIMQLNPETCRNAMFSACMFVVDEPKEFGAQGYVQSLGENGETGGQAYYRARWNEMERTGGMSPFMPANYESASGKGEV